MGKISELPLLAKSNQFQFACISSAFLTPSPLNPRVLQYTNIGSPSYPYPSLLAHHFYSWSHWTLVRRQDGVGLHVNSGSWTDTCISELPRIDGSGAKTPGCAYYVLRLSCSISFLRRQHITARYMQFICEETLPLRRENQR